MKMKKMQSRINHFGENGKHHDYTNQICQWTHLHRSWLQMLKKIHAILNQLRWNLIG